MSDCHEENPVQCGCHFLDAFSHSCTQREIRIDEWRSEEFCKKEICENNLIWNENGHLNFETCQKYRFKQISGNENSKNNPKTSFSSGCVCQYGQILREDNMCVAKEECGCELHGELYQNGASIIRIGLYINIFHDSYYIIHII